MDPRGTAPPAASQPTQPRQSAVLVYSSETAVADDIRDQNRRYFSGSCYGEPSVATLKARRRARKAVGGFWGYRLAGVLLAGVLGRVCVFI